MSVNTALIFVLDDGLVAALCKVETTKYDSVKSLRKCQHGQLSNMISGLWFAILYRAVEMRSRDSRQSHKMVRSNAINCLLLCLRAGKEVAQENIDASKIMSKRMRSGHASWTILLQNIQLLAMENFSKAPSKEGLSRMLRRGNYLQSACSMSYYRALLRRVLNVIDKIISRTTMLSEFVENGLKEVVDVLNQPSSTVGKGFEEKSINQCVKTHSQSMDNDDILLETPGHHDAILVERVFIRSAYPRHIVDYDSPIFISVQTGDIEKTQLLFQQGMASIYDTDPYGLGLLYYAGYYCWRSSGSAIATRICKMLIQLGADTDVQDEIGNIPIQTMTESALVEMYKDQDSTSLVNVALLCNMTSQEIVEDYRSISGLTTLHESLLGINLRSETLSAHLEGLKDQGLLPQLIDMPDSRGRSALAWAVEYGMADAVSVLLSFGADATQHRISCRRQLPLLHLVIAGPPPSPSSDFIEVVRILLASNIDINVEDDQGWTAWHIAASWRSYDILRMIMQTHGPFLKLDARTHEGESAHDLSQDVDFYKRLMPSWLDS